MANANSFNANIKALENKTANLLRKVEEKKKAALAAPTPAAALAPTIALNENAAKIQQNAVAGQTMARQNGVNPATNTSVQNMAKAAVQAGVTAATVANANAARAAVISSGNPTPTNNNKTKASVAAATQSTGQATNGNVPGALAGANKAAIAAAGVTGGSAANQTAKTVANTLVK